MDPEIEIIKLADMYLYFYRSDHAYKYALKDPRSLKLNVADFPALWKPNDARPEEAWPLRGLGAFSLAAIHLWRRGVSFDYLDIGANIGQTTMGQAIFFKRCGIITRVHAFEPGEVFDLLAKATMANRVGDIVSCINAAASDQGGEVIFYLTPKQSPAGSMIRDATERKGILETREVVAQTITIDDYIGQSKIGAILAKIDTEGADLKVLSGMQKTMDRLPCVIQIEFFPSLMRGYTDPAQRIVDLCSQFDIIDTMGGNNSIVNAQDIDALMKRVEDQPMPMTDLILVSKKMPNSAELVDRLLME